MELTTTSFENGGVIPEKYALARPVPDGPVTFADNHNPQLSWSGVPEGTRSIVVICVDPCCPSQPDDVNQPDREVPSDLARVDFYHWVAVDLPAALTTIDEGEFSDGVVPHGRQVAKGPHGCRQGLNDYTGWFAEDPDMAGKFYGYDGPAPPWNDSMVHEYVFTVYAVDQYRTDVHGDFTGQDVVEAIEGHVLDQASISGFYTQNVRLRAGG